MAKLPIDSCAYEISTSLDDPYRIGRLSQRLIEIETYGALSFLAWETFIDFGPLLQQADDKLKVLVESIADADATSDRSILSKLAHLAATNEANIADSGFRLNASLAYNEIVKARILELNEERIEGYQRFNKFIGRHGAPAARTYAYILKRQDKISERLHPANQLLRSRIDVELASQNQLQLTSMNRRAEAQYRLQKTVEGISAIAISYYLLGIVSYAVSAVGQVHGQCVIRRECRVLCTTARGFCMACIASGKIVFARESLAQ